jgi:hypothetical protein
MSLLYQNNGCLVPGVYLLKWEEFVTEFGFNSSRKILIKGLKQAIAHLKEAGCKNVWIDGSFTTRKPDPQDFDACWDPAGVNFELLQRKYPILFYFILGTKTQKDVYGGELYPSPKFFEFFQNDRDNQPKGIIQLKI